MFPNPFALIPKPVKRTPIEAPVVFEPKAAKSAPNYLTAIVSNVEENWEQPDPAQYQYGFEGYIQDILGPIAELEDELEQQQLQLRLKIERMMEIAPDLFDKALRKSGLEIRYFIGEPRDDN
ncbi:MAG: hypothetical protein ACE360_11335 [Hyphomicrobiales bacterium]